MHQFYLDKLTVAEFDHQGVYMVICLLILIIFPKIFGTGFV